MYQRVLHIQNTITIDIEKYTTFRFIYFLSIFNVSTESILQIGKHYNKFHDLRTFDTFLHKKFFSLIISSILIVFNTKIIINNHANCTFNGLNVSSHCNSPDAISNDFKDLHILYYAVNTLQKCDKRVLWTYILRVNTCNFSKFNHTKLS